MFEKITNFFRGLTKKEKQEGNVATSKDTAKERLHLVLMQDRANVSADFLELMKQEIIDVIKKYIEVDEGAIDVRLTNKANDDGTTGAPALYANIPIMNIKHEMGKDTSKVENENEEEKQEEKSEEVVEEKEETENILEKPKEEPTKDEQTSENNEEKQEQTEEVKNEEEKKEEATVVDNTVNN